MYEDRTQLLPKNSGSSFVIMPRHSNVQTIALAAEPIGQGGQLPAHFLLPMGKP